MGAGHEHGGRRHPGVSRMLIAAGILSVFFVIELTTALLINSIALLADAGHMLTDLVAMFMGLTAVLAGPTRQRVGQRTYGWHRAEVFTAVANAVLLLFVAGFILYEAVERFGDAPDIPGVPMIVVALAGLIANAGVGRAPAAFARPRSSLAVKGAYMEVVADTVAQHRCAHRGHRHGHDALALRRRRRRRPCRAVGASARDRARAGCVAHPVRILAVPRYRTSKSYAGCCCADSTVSPKYTTCTCGRWFRARTWPLRT